MLILLVLVACDQSGTGQPGAEADSTADPDTPIKADASSAQRIVSLTPAVTRMLIDLGKRDQLVGVSRDDDAALGLPICGSYNDPIIAEILRLEPDLVITESPFGKREEVPELLRSLADRGIFELVVLQHSRSISDIETALTDQAGGLGQAIDAHDAAARTKRLMAIRLDLIRSVVADAKPPRVLMLIEPSTLGALGPGATHDEMLKIAGGINAVASFKTDYLKLTRAQVQQTVRPDVVLIFEPGGQPIQDNDTRLRALEGLAVPAVMQRRVVVINHPRAMLPATSLPEVVKQMAQAIHPDRAEAIDRVYAMAGDVLDRAEAANQPAEGAER